MAKYQTTDIDQNQMVMLNYGELFSEEHPTRKLLELIRKLDLKDTLYRHYSQNTNTCLSCSSREFCADKRGRREVRVADAYYKEMEKKFLADKRSIRKGPRLSSPWILQMREKLKSYLGKRVYSFRFPVVEGTIAVLKEIRQGSKFSRRGFNRVQTEWTENLLKNRFLCNTGCVAILPFR